MTWTDPANEYEALVYITDRLSQHFPDVSEQTIERLVIDGLEKFGSSRIRTYVPMLIERDALAQLRRLSAHSNPARATPHAC